MAKSTTSRPSPPANRPNPIQNFQFTKEDFQEPSRINLLFQQLIPAVNGLQGVAGPSVLPSGIDVKGSTVSGLGAPQSPSDAISSGHAEGNYSAPVLNPQLDIGGPSALKGLSNLYLNFNKLQGQITGGFPAYTGGNVIQINGAIIQFDLVASMGGSSVNNVTVTFPLPFPNACQFVGAVTTGPADRITYISGLPTTTGFTVSNNGSGAGAFWLAVGW